MRISISLVGALALSGFALAGCQAPASTGSASAAASASVASTVAPPATSSAPAAVTPTGPTPFAKYRARLSKQDHVNGKDAGLTAASEILEQDRANYHVYNKRDAEDETDPVFVDLPTREKMNVFLVAPAPDVAAKIVHGTPLVEVSIFKTDTGGYSVQVTPLAD